ncbi:MAG TPA: hypothetical protein VES59_11130 [Bacteroidota bacterium]|nr:hypothetical protein [Bacteroidota bacterium]
MLEETLSYLGFQFAKLQFRSDVDTIQPMTEFLTGARNVLITLPTGYDNSILAGAAIRSYRERLSHLHITIVHNSTRSTPLSEFPRSEVVRIDPHDINRFSLPRRQLLKRIMTRPYDVAVDLNLDFVLHTAYICKVSRARVRVGFAHSAADLFYNVQLNLNASRSPQALYEKFAECLAMFG